MDTKAFCDPFGYSVNGNYTELTTDPVAVMQSGSAAFRPCERRVLLCYRKLVRMTVVLLLPR
jgi:hypothetical protein